MRLWTVHPKYLDAKGLVALWREGLLAQKVLAGRTKGYRHHPQLIRFQAHDHPMVAIRSYLTIVYDEANRRGYRFDGSKIGKGRDFSPMRETSGQIAYEWQHLKQKLQKRAKDRLASYRGVVKPEAHPLFQIVRGKVRFWEKLQASNLKPQGSARRQAQSAKRRSPKRRAKARSE